MEISQMRSSPGLLYPMMIIAAIAVIVFSIIGIASIAGWIPNAMLGSGTAMAAEIETPVAAVQRTDGQAGQAEAPAFQCAECGVIESVREIERRGTLWSTPVASADERTTATTGL